MNKKGDEKLLSFWLIVVWAMVGVVVVGLVLRYYAVTMDVRKTEADILAMKILNCVSDNGYLNENILNGNFDVYAECNLKKEIIENGEYFINISVYEGEVWLNKDYPVIGVKNFDILCELAEEAEAEQYPRCVNRQVYVSRQGYNQLFLLNIKTGVNQLGSRL